MSRRAPVDCVVVGGGIIGLATAREWLKRQSATASGGRYTLTLLEKEEEVATHQTGHNSGVVHAGIYYVPGSVKARLCVRGMSLAYQYMMDKGIQHRKCGKLIVATRTSQLDGLRSLFTRAQENSVADIAWLDRSELLRIEPMCSGGLAAVFSPHTGIVDWVEFARHIASDIRSLGGNISCGTEVVGFERHERLWRVDTRGKSAPKSLFARSVICCGGLQSDRLSAMSGGPRDPAILPIRGEYFSVVPSKQDLVSSLVYPVPDPSLPFLGVHLTPTVHGQLLVGPNAVPALAREAYSWTSRPSPKDLFSSASFPGTYRLAARQGRSVLKSSLLSAMGGSIARAAAAREAAQFAPGLFTNGAGDLQPAPGRAGVRAQAVDLSGKLVDDFVLECKRPDIVHVRNAPSPGATSSLAIAEWVADKAEDHFRRRNAVEGR